MKFPYGHITNGNTRGCLGMNGAFEMKTLLLVGALRLAGVGLPGSPGTCCRLVGPSESAPCEGPCSCSGHGSID